MSSVQRAKEPVGLTQNQPAKIRFLAISFDVLGVAGLGSKIVLSMYSPSVFSVLYEYEY